MHRQLQTVLPVQRDEGGVIPTGDATPASRPREGADRLAAATAAYGIERPEGPVPKGRCAGAAVRGTVSAARHIIFAPPPRLLVPAAPLQLGGGTSATASRMSQ